MSDVNITAAFRALVEQAESTDPDAKANALAVMQQLLHPKPATSKTYKWSKQYAVVTSLDDPAQVGDIITVGDTNGGSQQKVLAIAEQPITRGGKDQKVMLVREAK